MSHFVKLAVLTLGSLTAALSFGAVNAATPESPPSVVVKYSPQDLSTEQGVKEVYRRIVRAAKQVCPEYSYSFNLSLQSKMAECRDQAVARAVRQIDNSQLAALYAQHSKNS
jgi:UrcA family protein